MSTSMFQELFQSNNPLFCCLCLNKTTEKELMQINSEVHLNSTDSSENVILMSDMINHVLHREECLTTFVCSSCLTSTVNAYKFIEMCKKATQRLTKFVDAVSNCLKKPDTKQIKKSHRVFIAIDNNSLQSTLSYDTKKYLPHTKGYSKFQCTLSRFQAVCFPETVPRFICEACGIVCTNRASLVKHIKNKCNKKDNTQTACTFCGMLVSKRCLSRHMRACGNKASEDPTTHHLCNICGKSFIDLKKHIKTHDPNVSFECKKCNKKYRCLKSYKKHIDNKICTNLQRDPSETRPHKCKDCKAQFCSSGGLKFHMRIHSDNKNDYFECRWCQKRFPGKGQLASHAITHTKEKNWSCTICGGQFVTKASLTYHVRTHTGEKPYKCELCERSFLSASRRRDHMRSQHLPPQLECEYCHRKFKLHVEIRKHRLRHLEPKSSLYIGKKQPNTIKDGGKVCHQKIPTSKMKNYNRVWHVEML